MLYMNAPMVLQDLLPSRHQRPLRAHEPLVQVSTRLPADLRDAARDVATRSGITLTELVERALRSEIARSNDPAAQFSAQVADALMRRVADALDDGRWDEAVAAYAAGDPDLSS